MRRIPIWGIILGTFLIFNFFVNSAYGQLHTIIFDELNINDDQPLPLDQYTNLGVQFSSDAGGTAFVWKHEQRYGFIRAATLSGKRRPRR